MQPSVELRLPVGWDAPGRARHRLIERMVLRIRKLRAEGELVSPVVVEPVLVRLEAADDRVAHVVGVMTGML